MKLKDKALQPAIAGLPAYYLEWWDIGDGYEISVHLGKEVCSLGIAGPSEKDITYEIASLLGIDVSEESLIKRNRRNEKLYLSLGIDCVMLNSRDPENYKELLKKIEVIINEKFKGKSRLG